MKKNAIGFALLFTVLAVTAKAQHSSLDEGTKHTSKVLFKRDITSLPDVKGQEAHVVLVNLAPGEAANAHRHPLATIGYVLEGEIESIFEGRKYIYKTGDTFWEEPNGLHTQTKNLSTTREAKLLVFFLGAKGTPFLVPEKK
jgi:quercetin dioxygenase-like cupin family protein